MINGKSKMAFDPTYRMQNDPVFRNLAHAMYQGMKEGTFTPTDIREALLSASLRIEQERDISSMFIPATIDKGE